MSSPTNCYAHPVSGNGCDNHDDSLKQLFSGHATPSKHTDGLIEQSKRYISGEIRLRRFFLLI
jgi:hypothetical protein